MPASSRDASRLLDRLGVHATSSSEWLHDVVDLFVRLVESAGAIVIFSGAAVAFARLFAGLVRRRTEPGSTAIRLRLGRSLALGLEFQLASDLLRTAIAPTFSELGKLAAVAAIRTALNYFLARELAAENKPAPAAT